MCIEYLCKARLAAGRIFTRKSFGAAAFRYPMQAEDHILSGEALTARRYGSTHVSIIITKGYRCKIKLIKKKKLQKSLFLQRLIITASRSGR